MQGSPRRSKSQVKESETSLGMTKLQEVLGGSRYRAQGRFWYRALPVGEDRALPGGEDGIRSEAAR